MSRWLLLLIPLGLLAVAVGFGLGVAWSSRPTPTLTPTNAPTATASLTVTLTPTSTSTDTPSPTDTPTASETATSSYPASATPRPSRTPIPSATPQIKGRVQEQANCRYGPGAAYLYEWGLYPGNHVTVLGRNQDGTWLYVDPWTYTDYCWVKASLLSLTGDVSNLPQIHTLLPYTEFYWPPRNVSAVRSGNEVSVFWDMVPMSLDDNRGYLIEAWLCQGGQLLFTAVNPWESPALLHDEPGCMEPSSARIYTAEKHGYTQWIRIAWPPAVPATDKTPSPTP